ncbi:MAG: D-hexose-6-phosphate mutarotase [Acidobacteriota bacterium]|nr:D-hexose-6-phosphate mutarotase [Acidobacteriota bacterium]
MAEAAELKSKFAIPGVLDFETTAAGLVVARVTTPAAEATIYLHGAHLTHWKPAGQAPAIFLSERSEFATDKPIRGGVPVIFPWFGERSDGKTGPMHGFARISEWTLAFAAMAGDDLHLTFTLAPNELSHLLGYDHFKLAYTITIGHALTLELTVLNDSGSGGARHVTADLRANGSPLVFEEALHTYFAVANARMVSIDGLGGTTYLDKVDGMKRKVQPAGALKLEGRTDRPYVNTDATCVLHDPAGTRRIVIAKTGSRTTVVWNPWDELSAKMPDMGPDAWLHMTCVETANAGEDVVTLAAGATHSMRTHISIEKTA